MTKDELSAEQAEERVSAVAVLQGAGWTPTRIHVDVDEGLWAANEVEMEHDNGEMKTLVAVKLGRRVLHLYLTVPSGRGLDLDVEYGDRLLDFLRQLVAVEGNFKPQTYKKEVLKLREICPTMYRVVDGERKGLVKGG